MAKIHKNPYHGYQTLSNRAMHLTARNLVAATNILVNAAHATTDGTERVLINISIPLFTELLATIHTAAHEINPPNLALPTANTITRETAPTPDPIQCSHCHNPSPGGLFYVNDQQLCGACFYTAAVGTTEPT